MAAGKPRFSRYRRGTVEHAHHSEQGVCVCRLSLQKQCKAYPRLLVTVELIQDVPTERHFLRHALRTHRKGEAFQISDSGIGCLKSELVDIRWQRDSSVPSSRASPRKTTQEAPTQSGPLREIRCGGTKMSDRKAFATILATLSMLLAARHAAQANDQESTIIFEMGGGGEWGIPGKQRFGPEIGLEYTIIKHWLEVEVSTSPLFLRGQAEIGTDLIFKTPFAIADTLELLAGAGAEWIHRFNRMPDSVAGVVAVDFVYEILPERHVSVFVQPVYSYDFGKDHEQTLGFTTGLHIGLD